MKSNGKILAVFLTAVLTIITTCTGVFAADTSTGIASIGFSSGGIYYVPQGISGVEATLDLNFGLSNVIDTSTLTQTYTSLNQGGYVVDNQTGGTSGYRVSLGLSSFSNGLEGAVLTLYPDNQGLISGGNNMNPPILMNNMGYAELEADGLSSALILEGFSSAQDPNHIALGRWGFNFYGDLKVYTDTIKTGYSQAVMTWELGIV